jgi:hypothetical protein
MVSNRGAAWIGQAAGLLGAIEADLLEQQIDLEQVGGGVGLGDDMGADGLRPEGRRRAAAAAWRYAALLQRLGGVGRRRG